MLYFSRMRWNLEGMNFNQLWKLESKEADAAVVSIQQGFISHLYKPCAEQYVISVGETRTVEDFDRYAEGVLPMREHLVFEEVWPLDEGFCIDVFPYLQKRRKEMAETPRLLHFFQASWSTHARYLDDHWLDLVGQLRDLDAPKVLGVYRVAGQQRIIAFVDVQDATELSHLANLSPMASAEVERVEALRDYLGFAEDVRKGYRVDPPDAGA